MPSIWNIKISFKKGGFWYEILKNNEPEPDIKADVGDKIIWEFESCEWFVIYFGWNSPISFNGPNHYVMQQSPGGKAIEGIVMDDIPYGEYKYTVIVGKDKIHVDDPRFIIKRPGDGGA
jgi:hypothetical protein